MPGCNPIEGIARLLYIEVYRNTTFARIILAKVYYRVLMICPFVIPEVAGGCTPLAH